MTFPRVRAMIFVAVLFVTAGVVVLTAVNRDTQNEPVADPCEPGDIRVNVTVPKQEQVTLNIYNATDSRGLAEQIAAEFVNRGFTANVMEGVPEVSPFETPYEKAGYLIYGPEGFAAGWLVSAYFLPGEYEPKLVPEREGAEVDVILGADFQQLTTSSEVNQRIADMGPPKPPEGTCAAV